MEKKEMCDILYNGYSIRVQNSYEEIKHAINLGSSFLELTEVSSTYGERKYLANVSHIVSIIPILK